MKKSCTKLLALVLSFVLLSTSVMASDTLLIATQDTTLQPVTLWGQLHWQDDTSFLLENQTLEQSWLIHTDETLYLSATTGEPLDATAFQDGDTVYVYTSPAMTFSIPPQTSAWVVLGNIPLDFGVPGYYIIDGSVVVNADSIALSTGDEVLTIDNSVALTQFDTAQTITWQTLTAGSGLLVWRDGTGAIYRTAVILAQADDDDNLPTIAVDDDLTVTLNSAKVLSMKAQLHNDQLFLPLRAIGEALGRDVWWDSTYGACVQGTEFYSILPNGGVTCFVENGTTYVEATLLAQGLGFAWG